MRSAVDELEAVFPTMAPLPVFAVLTATFVVPSNAGAMPHKTKLINKAYRFIISISLLDE
jgi:hypothetical protein